MTGQPESIFQSLLSSWLIAGDFKASFLLRASFLLTAAKQ
jgi:hypothetical protein